MSESDASQNQPAGYVPPEVWDPNTVSGGAFASINKPTSGAQFERELPVGKHPFQLYSLGTPNGVKVTIMLEELLALGHAGAEYDAWLINIGAGDQFGSGFVAINPNSKIPAMMDHSVNPPVRLFESASMLVYLAEKFGEFWPSETHKRAETLNWVMWQMGAAPFLGGGFGHFYAYAPIKIQYAIDRYAMEVKRQLHLLDNLLAERKYIIGDDYTIADMAIFPWYAAVLRTAYDAQKFLAVDEYTHVRRWVEMLNEREAVQRGRMVNQSFGKPENQLPERHDARDFEHNRADQLAERNGERITFDD